MITPETPLPEVAHFLGARTAGMVDRQDSDTQILTLIALRAYLVELESGPTLDPITLEDALHRFTSAFLTAYKGERHA